MLQWQTIYLSNFSESVHETTWPSQNLNKPLYIPAKARYDSTSESISYIVLWLTIHFSICYSAFISASVIAHSWCTVGLTFGAQMVRRSFWSHWYLIWRNVYHTQLSNLTRIVSSMNVWRNTSPTILWYSFHQMRYLGFVSASKSVAQLVCLD